MSTSKYGFKSLTDAQCDQIYSEAKQNVARSQLAVRYGVSDRTIGRVIAKVDEINLAGGTKIDESQSTSTAVDKPVAIATTQPVSDNAVAPVAASTTQTPLSEAADKDFFAITDGLSITISYMGNTKSVTKKEPNFDLVKNTLFNDGAKQAYLLLASEIQKVKHVIGSNPHISFKEGKVFYKNIELHFETVVAAINNFAASGDEASVRKLLNFMDKLVENPSESSIKMLYKFITHNAIEITSDGDLVAFKAVRSDYKDCHSGTFDNSVGTIVKMDRRAVVENPDVTCAAGLHACSWQYLSSSGFGSNDRRVVKVLINPRDVVSVPNDYDGTKLRCCEYKVIADVG